MLIITVRDKITDEREREKTKTKRNKGLAPTIVKVLELSYFVVCLS